MSAALAHVAALMLIKSIAEGNNTVATLPRIAKIAAAALGGALASASQSPLIGDQSDRVAMTEGHST